MSEQKDQNIENLSNTNVIDHTAIDSKCKIKNKLNNMKSQRKRKPPSSNFDILNNVKKMIMDVHTNQEFIKIDVPKNKHDFMKNRHPKLHKDFLPIFDAVFKKELKSDHDLKMLSMMLGQKKMIDRGRKTEYKASTQIGQVLFDKYVKEKF